MAEGGSYSDFPNGVTSFGIPVIGSGSIPVSAGNYFFVCSVNGSNGNEGTAGFPFATIDYAIGQCTANKGDTIVVLQGHAETITAAGGITCDIAGVNIIGMGTGADRPEITFSTAVGASVLITAANVQIANIVGISGIDALTNPFHVQAAGCTLGAPQYGPIEWQDPSSSFQAVRTVLTTAAADNLSVFLKTVGITSGGTSPVNAVRLVGCNTGKIVLDFYGRASTSVVEFITTACSNIEVYGYMYNSGVTDFSKDVIDTVTGSTWFASFYDGAYGGSVSGGSAAALAGDDVSAVSTQVTNVQTALNNGVPRMAIKTIANTATALTTGLSPVTAFTVTGDVYCRVWGTVQTLLTSTSNNGTLAVGVAGATSVFLAATTMDGTQFPSGSVWIDTTPTVAAEVFVAANLVQVAVAGGADIIITVATNSSTAGALTLYCQWVPVSSGATVVAA